MTGEERGDEREREPQRDDAAAARNVRVQHVRSRRRRPERSRGEVAARLQDVERERHGPTVQRERQGEPASADVEATQPCAWAEGAEGLVRRTIAPAAGP